MSSDKPPDRRGWDQFLKDTKLLRESYAELLNRVKELETAKADLVKELEAARTVLGQKPRTTEALHTAIPAKFSPTEKQAEIDVKGVVEIRELRGSIKRALKEPETPAAAEQKPGTTEKTEADRETISLPAGEWKALTNDVRKLVQADEGILGAYNRLSNQHSQLSSQYNQLSSEYQGLANEYSKRITKTARREGQSQSRVRRLFRRKQKPTYVGLCPTCGGYIEIRDRFCPACGRTLQSYAQGPGATQPGQAGYATSSYGNDQQASGFRY